MTKMLLDTSFLISAIKGKIDIVAELRKFGKPELCVLHLVVKELKMLSEGRGKTGSCARLSLIFLKNEGASVIRSGADHTDRKIIAYASGGDVAVCTVDGRLKKDLIERGVTVITIRQCKYLVRVPLRGRY